MKKSKLLLSVFISIYKIVWTYKSHKNELFKAGRQFKPGKIFKSAAEAKKFLIMPCLLKCL